MKLTDLNPKFVSHGGEGVTNSKTGEQIPYVDKIGISFDCPCGECGERTLLCFENPVHGGAAIEKQNTWKRKGETFETMTLTPSIQRMGGCRWHGYLTNGELKSC